MDEINTVIVGFGLAGRHFHAPLIQRQSRLRLHGVVARDPRIREEAQGLGVPRVYPELQHALDDPATDLVVIATPHDTHADLAIRVLGAGRACVVDKVMALTTADADRMIAAAQASGKMLSVFHNRRWDWDFLTVGALLVAGRLGSPLLIESSVCRFAPPRTWRGKAAQAGTILHDWGAHLVDQALRMGLGPCRRIRCWIIPAPWPDVDTGGHGRIAMDFDQCLVQVETSRISRNPKPRWWILGTSGSLEIQRLDPHEDALRRGQLDDIGLESVPRAVVRTDGADGVQEVEETLDLRGSWDAFYKNIAAHLLDGIPLAVTAAQAREVVRLLEAAERSAREHTSVEGPWGGPTS